MKKLNFVPFPEISTKRLLLRSLNLSDDNEIHFLRSDSEVNKYIDRPLSKSIDDAREFITKINSGVEENKWIFWAITMKNEEKLIGTICLWNFSDDRLTAEVGFELLPEYQSKGFIGEALKNIINYGFNKLNLDKIEGYTNQKNTPSIKVMEKYNFSFDKSIDEEHSNTGEKVQTVIYKLENKKG